MSLQDRLSSQDALQLLTTAASLSLITATSVTGATYNFPLMLFGIVAHEMRSSTAPFRQFLVIILFTAIFDLYTLLTHSLHGFVLLISVLLALLKIPIFFTCLVQLRERGGDLRWGQGGFGFQGLGGTAAGGASNWNMPMPGGFGGQPQQPSAQAAQPGTFPSSGGFRLGGEDDPASPPPPPPPQTGRGGYQTIA
ncbi:hypothetical protein BCR39DRAFT_542675 [Naematelia encephala]|uniref:Uncharacterized protein n=1 Tax=Naematelia encephala TaxID=71784 RepID=A0A1Y2ATP4_9TREE|nr:hypothetical protein BCR39DRAFT_542675 [Naematelia encephala]